MGMVYNFLPFMVLPIYNVLMKIGDDKIEAARDLGANAFPDLCEGYFPHEHARCHQRHYHGIRSRR